MSAQVKRLSIVGFRGAPTPLVLEFVQNARSTPASAILVGDNGTGKSTIVDALELALQGTFIRGTSLTAINQPSPLSLSALGEAAIIVELDDGTEIKKRIWKDEFESVHCSPHAHPSYGWCPIVLRRKDILAFLNSSLVERQLFFFDYFSRPDDDLLNRESDFETLAIERIKTKKARRTVVAQLAEELHVTPEDIPAGKRDFEEFTREFVYKGLNARHREQAMEAGRLFVRPKIQSLLAEHERITQEASSLDTKLNQLRNRHRLPRPEAFQRLNAFLAGAATNLSRWFAELSTAGKFVEGIELIRGELTEVSLQIGLRLRNGQRCTAHQVLSEANLDLIALLLFVSIAQQAATFGQERLLILDDVLQSVDSVIRMSFSELLMKEFYDWQLVFTVHDRMWHNQLRELFRRYNKPFVERQLTRWTFDSGPTLAEPSADLDERVLSAIQQGDLEASCALCGLLLEAVCQRMSWVLGTSVTRRKEDKYTLGDLWPGVAKKLRKSNVATCAEDVDKWIHLRNLVGAHYNEWAHSLSLNDAESFCTAVCALYLGVFCKSCYTWVEEKASDNYRCRCEQIQVVRQ